MYSLTLFSVPVTYSHEQTNNLTFVFVYVCVCMYVWGRGVLLYIF